VAFLPRRSRSPGPPPVARDASKDASQVDCSRPHPQDHYEGQSRERRGIFAMSFALTWPRPFASHPQEGQSRVNDVAFCHVVHTRLPHHPAARDASKDASQPCPHPLTTLQVNTPAHCMRIRMQMGAIACGMQEKGGEGMGTCLTSSSVVIWHVQWAIRGPPHSLTAAARDVSTHCVLTSLVKLMASGTCTHRCHVLKAILCCIPLYATRDVSTVYVLTSLGLFYGIPHCIPQYAMW
jgi:hypothetical protein